MTNLGEIPFEDSIELIEVLEVGWRTLIDRGGLVPDFKLSKADFFSDYTDKNQAEREWNVGKALYEKVKDHIVETAQACRDNGNEMLSDAQYLFDGQRYSRAAAIAILAAEELAKATVLIYSHDSEYLREGDYKKLCLHPPKHQWANLVFQTFYDGKYLSDVSDLCLDHHEVNKSKNSSLYVLCDRKKGDLTIESTPDGVTREIAAKQINRAKALKKWGNLLFPLGNE